MYWRYCDGPTSAVKKPNQMLKSIGKTIRKIPHKGRGLSYAVVNSGAIASGGGGGEVGQGQCVLIRWT
jgi:hypothetical protein